MAEHITQMPAAARVMAKIPQTPTMTNVTRSKATTYYVDEILAAVDLPGRYALYKRSQFFFYKPLEDHSRHMPPEGATTSEYP